MSLVPPGIYGWSPGNGGVHHYRIAEPLRVATMHGVRTATGVELDNDIAMSYDTILVHMLHHEHALPAWEKLAASGCHRLVLDVDDAMWAPDWDNFRTYYTPDRVQRLYRAAQLAHVVTTPSDVIAEHLIRYNPNVHFVPNSVPEYLLHQRPRARAVNVVGYQGSASHDPDITDDYLTQMYRFCEDHPAWQMWFWGKRRKELAGWPEEFVRCMPWQDNLRSYYRSLSMDIGVGPLKGSVFTDSKSALRAIEYAALGIPAVLSDSPAYRGWVVDGETGYLMNPTDSWYEVLHLLATDDTLRAAMGRGATKKAQQWTTEKQIGNWVNAWNSV